MTEPPPLVLSFTDEDEEPCLCSACRMRRELRLMDASELAVIFYTGVAD